MSLTLAVMVLAVVALLVTVLARLRPADVDFAVVPLLVVMLTVRGTEPGQFYVQLAAGLLMMLAGVLALRSVPRDIHKAFKKEWLLLGGAVIAMVCGEILPEASQRIAVIIAVVLAALFLLRAGVRGTQFVLHANRIRASRNR